MDKKTILVIDDEEMVRSFLEHYFRQNDYTVITQPDGARALQYLLGGHPADAVIADINMPVMNGLDFIKAIRSQARLALIPIIVLSGNDKSISKINALNVGADDYVVKPFNPEEILARINVIFRRMELMAAKV
jgi:DNA-binding response OmpR family regulator